MSYKSCQLGVYNVMGQKVFSEVNSNNTFKINIQGLQPGVYFIEATNTFGKTTRVKFVKE